MSRALWLSQATLSSWWKLPDRQVRVAFALLSLAEAADSMTIRVTGQALADLCLTSRWSVMRALDALQSAGLCRVSTHKGRNNATTIELTSPAHLISGSAAHFQTNVTNKETVDSEIRPHISFACEPHTFQKSDRTFKSKCAVESEHPVTVKKSLAALGDLGSKNRPDPHTFDLETETNSGQKAPDPSDFSRAPDLDLLRSPDLRSSDLEILRRSPVAARSPQTEAPIVTTTPETMDTEPPTTEPPEPVADPGPKTRKPKTPRIDPAKIPERAWAAADYLRTQVLAKNPSAMVGVKPWEFGWEWSSGKMNRVGDGSRRGLRLAWANSLRMFQATLQQAFVNGHEPSTDDNVWDEIAKVIKWVFRGQPAGVGFIVESPDSLRSKWDRILEVRGNSEGKRGPALAPTEQESACARRLLNKLGIKAKVSYTALPQHVALIAGQLRSNVTEREMEAVIAYCDDQWRQPEMRKNLRPETLFGPDTIARYLDAARTKYSRQLAAGSEIGARLTSVPAQDDDIAPIHPIMAGLTRVAE